MINPINHTRTPEGVERYRVEPYAVAADVYAHPMHLGRGGWTWYTGSAGWMYQAAIEGMLGLRRARRDLQRRPVHPGDVAGVLDRLAGRADACIASRSINPEHRCRGVRSAELDGVAVEPAARSRCVDDGKTHDVKVVLGKPGAVAVGGWNRNRPRGPNTVISSR